MLLFDGILGEHSDPLMRAWADVDNQVNLRLFARGAQETPREPLEKIKLLRDEYMSLRVTVFKYIASLNDQILASRL